MSDPIRILLLEDLPTDADLVEHELRSAEIAFDSKRVDNRAAFGRALKEFGPDIILADFSLPQFTALDALELMRAEESEIPFILVTGTQSEEVAVACMKAGADDYLLKTSLTRLPRAMLNVLAKKAAERRREETEEALRRSEERYRLITENSRDLISMLNPDGTFVYVSPSSSAMLGYSPAECMMSSFFTRIHPSDREQVRQSVLEASSKRGSVRLEYRYNHKSGHWRILESVLSWILDDRGQPQRAVVVSRDITERREAEDRLKSTSYQLRALAARVQIVREEERKRIAREIHDELGQSLTGLKMDVASLAKKIGADNGPIAAKARSMSDLIDATIQTVRRISTELRPGILDDLGLVAAVEWQAQEFQARSGIRCEAAISAEDIPLDEARSTAVFRIFQESLTNIVRHSGATLVVVRLAREEGALTLEVTDNGKGITESALQDQKSLGLLGMKERALLVGGEFTVGGIEGGGTRVSVRVPLEVAHAVSSP